VPLSLGLQGLDAQDLPMAGLATRAVWRTGLGTSYGITAAAAFPALLLGLSSLRFRRRGVATSLSLVALLGVGAALASSGHASAASPQWLTRPAVFLHGVGIAVWAGSLVPLGLLLAARDAVAVPALERFSRAIPFALAPLIAAGITLAAIQVETPAAVLTTAYGRVFLVKMALVVTLLVLAALNRWRLTAPVLQGREVAARRLGRMIGLEAVLVLAILGTAALWRFTPPPRALLAAAAAPAEIHIHGGKAMADLSVTPGRAGPVTASIFVATGDLQPLEAMEVTLTLADPAAGIEPMRRTASRQGDGSWRVEGLTIPVAGRWSVRVDILVSDFDLVTLEDDLVIRP
jgi:copper transport protein